MTNLKASLAGAMGAVLIASFPVYAQSQSMGSQPGQGQAQQSQQQTPLTQDRVRQTLEQAGFQNIDILDASYLVRAKTKDGNTVTMVIDPPAIVEAMSETAENPQQGQQNTAFQGQSGQTRSGGQAMMGYGQGAQRQGQGSSQFGQLNYGAQGGRYWQGGQQSSQRENPRSQQYQGYQSNTGGSDGTSGNQGSFPNEDNQQ